MSRIFNNTTGLSIYNGTICGLRWNICEISGSGVWPGEQVRGLEIKKEWKIGGPKNSGVWECMYASEHQVNTLQRAPAIEETLNSQELPLASIVTSLPWTDMVVPWTEQLQQKNMKTIPGLPLTKASECLTFSDGAWKHTLHRALFLKETEQPLGGQTTALDPVKLCLLCIWLHLPRENNSCYFSSSLQVSYGCLSLANSNQEPNWKRECSFHLVFCDVVM